MSLCRERDMRGTPKGTPLRVGSTWRGILPAKSARCLRMCPCTSPEGCARVMRDTRSCSARSSCMLALDTVLHIPQSCGYSRAGHGVPTLVRRAPRPALPTPLTMPSSGAALFCTGCSNSTVPSGSLKRTRLGRPSLRASGVEQGSPPHVPGTGPTQCPGDGGHGAGCQLALEPRGPQVGTVCVGRCTFGKDGGELSARPGCKLGAFSALFGSPWLELEISHHFTMQRGLEVRKSRSNPCGKERGRERQTVGTRGRHGFGVPWWCP